MRIFTHLFIPQMALITLAVLGLEERAGNSAFSCEHNYLTPTAAFQDLGQQGAGVRVSNGDSNPGTLRQNVRTIFF